MRGSPLFRGVGGEHLASRHSVPSAAAFIYYVLGQGEEVPSVPSLPRVFHEQTVDFVICFPCSHYRVMGSFFCSLWA